MVWYPTGSACSPGSTVSLTDLRHFRVNLNPRRCPLVVLWARACFGFHLPAYMTSQIRGATLSPTPTRLLTPRTGNTLATLWQQLGAGPELYWV